MPNLLLYNGKLHTQDPHRPQATAVAIHDGRFLAVGSDAEIRALSGANTRLSEEILSHLKNDTLDGTDEPLRIYRTCYQALQASHDSCDRAIMSAPLF